MVVVNDISHFARNTVDSLQSVRKLKSLGIETQFLTANMTSMGNSEFVLTIFGALAQEESANTSKGEQLEAILNSTFKQLEDITDVHEMTNAQLKRLINKIEVDRDVNVDIYLRLIDDLGLDETVLIEGDENKEEKEIKADPNCHNHT